MEQHQAPVVAGEQARRHRQLVPLHDLLTIGDVHLAHEHRAAGLPPVILAQHQAIERRIGRVIEDQHVEGDVHVAVVVDPFRPHDFAVPPPRARCRVRVGHPFQSFFRGEAGCQEITIPPPC